MLFLGASGVCTSGALTLGSAGLFSSVLGALGFSGLSWLGVSGLFSAGVTSLCVYTKVMFCGSLLNTPFAFPNVRENTYPSILIGCSSNPSPTIFPSTLSS